jgi:hypothetical protein
MPSSTPVNRRALLTLLGGSIAAPLATPLLAPRMKQSFT